MFRYIKGSVNVRDIISIDGKIKILVSRDDEEYSVFEFEDFDSEILWKKFHEISRY
jgi:hypothetical protein